MVTRCDIWPGDIFSTANKGLLGSLNARMTKTPSGLRPTREHFGVIGRPVFDEFDQFVDFETRESIGKGIAPLRFFERYSGQDIEIYRIPGITQTEGIRLLDSISEIGDATYGYIDYLEAIVDVMTLLVGSLFTHRPPYTADEFHISKNDKYICTECAAYGPRVIGHPIEAPGHEDIWDIPVVYLQALEEERLIMYYKGNLEDIPRR